MRPDILADAVFPDYELTDHTSTRRKLSDLFPSHFNEMESHPRERMFRVIGRASVADLSLG